MDLVLPVNIFHADNEKIVLKHDLQLENATDGKATELAIRECQ